MTVSVGVFIRLFLLFMSDCVLAGLSVKNRTVMKKYDVEKNCNQKELNKKIVKIS